MVLLLRSPAARLRGRYPTDAAYPVDRAIERDDLLDAGALGAGDEIGVGEVEAMDIVYLDGSQEELDTAGQNPEPSSGGPTTPRRQGSIGFGCGLTGSRCAGSRHAASPGPGTDSVSNPGRSPPQRRPAPSSRL